MYDVKYASWLELIKLIQILCCSLHAGWIKTRPAQKLLVRVKFTGNPYRTYRTRINVNAPLPYPYLTLWVGNLLHRPSAEAVSVRPNAQPRCNGRSQ